MFFNNHKFFVDSTSQWKKSLRKDSITFRRDHETFMLGSTVCFRVCVCKDVYIPSRLASDPAMPFQSPSLPGAWTAIGGGMDL